MIYSLDFLIVWFKRLSPSVTRIDPPTKIYILPSTMALLRQICALLAFQFISVDAIVGGTDTVAGAFPYVASIYTQGWQGYRYTCSGAVIGPSTILTAASCVDGLTENNFQVRTRTLFKTHRHPPILQLRDLGE